MLLESALPPARHRDRHDAATAVWQSLARALYALAAAPEAETGPLAARAAALYDVSSALLLRSGPAFGEPVPGALRAALASHPAAPALDPLLRAVKDHVRVRVAVVRRPEPDLPAERHPVPPAGLADLLARCADGPGPLPPGCPERFGREPLARLAAVAVALCEETPTPKGDRQE
ncbi:MULTISPECIES: hypothetical protein [unclassified Streptomyces]|uniref:hypothetical protein n=1 Tax=unclassified Streptomyces TaxID=2593676 RepID=UPI002256B6A5|nr:MULTISPECIES: hypothetical protein [unclassified Streptomyces]MCX4528790.1 hypothetical protein [Streptomyces sp. NBC_01551]MCX4540602.1 hypothetical protein [Streptomyces sp. NBC_01565]